MRMTKGRKRNSILMLILLSVMLVGSRTTTTFASTGTKRTVTVDENTKNMNLGTQGIKNPTSTTSQATSWEGSKVYYGMNGNEGILWRVLNENGFLFQDKTITYRLYHEGLDDSTWETSTLRHYLNGYYFKGTIDKTDHVVRDYTNNNYIQTYFSKAEANAMTETKVSTEGTSNGISGGNTTTDKLFLLSEKEAKNKDYGFGSNMTRENSRWSWLRSPATTSKTYASIINKDGSIDTSGKIVNQEYAEGLAVNPAFNLDMSNVLFTTAAAFDKTANTTFGTKKMESDLVDQNIWKLTLRGTKETLNASSDCTSIINSEKTELKISHKKAAILNGATQVSAMLVDNDGRIVYYGKINDDVNAIESVITMPETVEAGTYKLRVFAEDINGGMRTDYATEFSDITINVNKKVEVTDITGLQKDMKKGESVKLTGEVYPKNASNTQVSFEVKDAANTEAVIKDGMLYAKNAGIVTITASVKNGLLNGASYEKEFKVMVLEPATSFVAVKEISNVPSNTIEGTKINLSCKVMPENAVNKQIVWSIKEQGTTKAVITNNTFVAKSAGTATIIATVKDGAAIGKDFVKEFKIKVRKAETKKDPADEYEDESSEEYDPSDFITTSNSEVIITTENSMETVTTTDTVTPNKTFTKPAPQSETKEPQGNFVNTDVRDEAVIHELFEEEDDMIITLSEGVAMGEEEEYDEEESPIELQEVQENQLEEMSVNHDITKGIMTGGIQKASFWWWLIVALLGLYVYLRHREKGAR